MSQRPPARRLMTAPVTRGAVGTRRLPTIPEGNGGTKLGPNLRKNQQKMTGPAAKAQRTSKTSQKLVVLPSEPQKKPLLDEAELEETLPLEQRRSVGERMDKEERKKAGYKRLAAYCIADGIKTKSTAAFLKREHGVSPRVFDEAIYVMYQLPLLPGYVPGVNVRSSAAAHSPSGESFVADLTEAEENGYDGNYFTSHGASSYDTNEGYMPSSPETVRKVPSPLGESQPVPSPGVPSEPQRNEQPPKRRKRSPSVYNRAEVVIFSYGVVVFFGLEQEHERAIIEDLENAGTLSRKLKESEWEVEECHFEHDADASRPRIYNDFFTLKSQSHLLKISISHALAQSTLLAHYETLTSVALNDPATLSIPSQLALTGKMKLRRREAMRLSGRLFKLKRDINLVSNVLDVPELFWSEASLGELYEGVRDYLEISARVEELNRKLEVVRDLLDLIHEHLNGNAMVRITWIIIWLIVVAIIVELGEALARVVVNASRGSSPFEGPSTPNGTISVDMAMLALQNVISTSA